MLDLIDSVNESILIKLENDFKFVDPEEIGLDRRAAYGLWYNSTGIVIKRAYQSSMEYYGGFEYVDKEYVTIIGNYVFYSVKDSRVADYLDIVEI